MATLEVINQTIGQLVYQAFRQSCIVNQAGQDKPHFKDINKEF